MNRRPTVQVTLAALRRVANDIDRAWAQRSYDIDVFPDIVLQKTDGLDLRPLGALEDTLTLLDDPEIADLQRPSTFSDLYLKLYDNGRFWIEVLNWWGSDINIHDHDFSGVQFQLAGRSLNVLYSFESAAEHEGVRFGDISVTEAEIWHEGDRSAVLPGRIAAHNVNHVDVPTVSLLIRTHPHASLGPQWNYFAPGVASSYGIADIGFRKRVKALRLLSAGSRDTFHDAFRQFTAKQDQSQRLFTLVKMIDIVFQEEHVNLVSEIAESDELAVRTVESVAFHRAAEIVKSLKSRRGLSNTDILTLSIVGSCFDAASARRIVAELGGTIDSMEFADALEGVRNRLAPPEMQQVQNALDLYQAEQLMAAT